MKPQRKAYFYALAAIACWSTIGSAFKISLRFIDPLPLLVISSFTATFVLLVILIRRNNLNSLKNITRNDWIISSLMGFLNPFLYYYILLEAYHILPAQEAGTLNYIWPLFLVLLSIPMLKQKISLLSIASILVSFSGIVIISAHGDLINLRVSNLTGVLLATGSAFIWALYWIFNIRDKREAVPKLLLNFCFGSLYTLIAIFFTGKSTVLSWQGVAGGVYIGIFEMGLTFVLWLNALKLSSTTAKVSNLIYLSPFISLILIQFVVGERILFSTITGLFFIIGGIILQQYLKR